MTEYTIAFDFPEAEGTSWFCARLDDGIGLTDSLETALKFEAEDAAERFLENAYGAGTKPYGVVVEVAA